MGERASTSLRADMAHCAQALAFVEAFCIRCGVAHDDKMRIVFVAEELFTNVVEHGHAGGADAPIRIELAREPGRILFFIEDTAPPFDPLAQPGADTDIDRPQEGGRGLRVVRAMASDLRYAREEGCNRLWVTMAIQEPPP